MAVAPLTKLLRIVNTLRTIDPEIPAQIAAVLFRVAERPGITISELIDQAGVKKSAVSRICERLSDRAARPGHPPALGLVRIQEDAVDLRVRRLTLTPQGQRIINALTGIVED